jgi:hypothetical protein
MDSPASTEPEQVYEQDNSDSSEEYDGSDLVEEDSDEDDSNVYVEYGWGGRTVRRVLQLDCPRLPVPQLPMQNGLAHAINSDTRPWPSNEPCCLVSNPAGAAAAGGAGWHVVVPRPAHQLQLCLQGYLSPPGLPEGCNPLIPSAYAPTPDGLQNSCKPPMMLLQLSAACTSCQYQQHS